MFDNLQPASWDGHSVSLGNGFELQEAKGDRGVHPVCSRQTHRFGGARELKRMDSCLGPKSYAHETKCLTCASSGGRWWSRVGG
jgi:hypothetical protein